MGFELVEHILEQHRAQVIGNLIAAQSSVRITAVSSLEVFAEVELTQLGICVVDGLDILVAEVFNGICGSVESIVTQKYQFVVLGYMQIKLKDIGVEILALHARFERKHRVFGHYSAARAVRRNKRGVRSDIGVCFPAVKHRLGRPRHERGVHRDKHGNNGQNGAQNL